MISQLTISEYSVFKLLIQAFSNEEIASMLNMSAKAVGVHAARIYAKLGRSRWELIRGYYSETEARETASR